MKKLITILVLLTAVTTRAGDEPPLPRITSFAPDDYAWVARDLRKAPAFKSAKVRYAIWVLGEGRKSVMTMAWDESGGTGTGYDTLYLDRNFDRDLTAADEVCVYPNPAPKGQNPPAGAPFEHYEFKGVKEADGPRVFEFVFDSAYNHDEIEYNSAYRVTGGDTNYEVGNLPWSLKLLWSNELKTAPVYRCGGPAIPIVSLQPAGAERRFLFAGEDLGTWNAGATLGFDVVVALIGERRDVQLRFGGSKFPGIGKGIQNLRWGGGGYPLSYLRIFRPDGGLLEDIPMNPGCP